MSAWPILALGDLFEIARGGSPRPIDDYITDDPDGINWVAISDASGSSKFITRTKRRIKRSGASRSRHVEPGDFLLTNSMSFGRPYIMQTTGCIHDGWLLLRPRQDVQPDYFYHLLGSDAIYAEFSRLAAGVTVKNLNIDLVRGVQVGVPPMGEQQRIAAILDEADALRAKRRAALAHLDEMARAFLVEVLSDVRPTSHGWERTKLRDLLSIPLRNGVSPATEGKVSHEVLTLSAVTGQLFKPAAKKAGLFAQDVPADKFVDAADFLMCRGNGNKSLVGRGFFPATDMSRVVFPDTMIAGRINEQVVTRGFFQAIWNCNDTRQQIERRARTTNGTFKINQEALEAVELPLPSLTVQRGFDKKIAAVNMMCDAAMRSSDAANTLFASLQHRAFRGDL